MENFLSSLYNLSINILLFFYCVSIIVASYSTFKISTSMKEWIDRIEASTEKGIIKIAQLSDEKALKALSIIFFILFGIFFIINILYSKIIGTTHLYFNILLMIFLYFSISIYAWSSNRNKILEDILLKFKKEFIIAIKITIGIFIIIFLVWITTQTSNIHINFDLLYIITLSSIILLILFITLLISNSFLIAFIFLPAVISIIYLKLVIFISKIILFLGKNKLNNLFIIYFIIGSIFQALK